MKVNLVNLFKPQVNSALKEKYANQLYPLKSKRVSVVRNVDPLVYTQIAFMEKEFDKVAKQHNSEFLFMQHPNSDAILMNFKARTFVMDLRELSDAISIALKNGLSK